MKSHNLHTRGRLANQSLRILGPLVLAAVLGAGLRAQDITPTPTLTPTPAMTPTPSGMATESDSLPHSDKGFMKKVARASTNEVALSQLADSRAMSPDVKSFAQMMITDHTQANTDLGKLASAKGVDLTKAINKGQEDDVSSLSAKNGADFDKAYAKKMLSAHEDAVKLFRKEADEGKDPDVVAFAKKYVDTLSMHLDKARALNTSVTQ